MVKGFPYPENAARSDVLFVLSAMGVGGSERKVTRVASALAASGIRTAVCALGPPYTLMPQLHEAVVARTLDRRRRVSLRVVTDLRALLAAQRPATVIAVDLFALLHLWMARAFAQRCSMQIVALINTTTFVRRRDRLFMFGYAPLLRRADLLVFGAGRQRDAWVKSYALPSAATRVIHNGVDVARFARGGELQAGKARHQAGLPPQRVVIGSVGRLAPEKNQIALVRALARLRAAGIDAHLLLAGEGAMRGALLAQATALGIADRLTLSGEVDDVRQQLAAMDLFVLPSTEVETFSNAALEAMAMSVPVVLSDLGGAREMIDHGKEGLIVPPADQQALEQALLALCADRDRLRAMGEAARARACSQFGFGQMVDAYRALIGQTVPPGAPP